MEHLLGARHAPGEPRERSKRPHPGGGGGGKEAWMIKDKPNNFASACWRRTGPRGSLGRGRSGKVVARKGQPGPTGVQTLGGSEPGLSGGREA